MLYTYKALIIDVYDGDTVTAIADLGFGVSIKLKIRLMGIDTPELRGVERPRGLIARNFLRGLILNKEVVIKTYKDKKGKFGRYLADLYLGDLHINGFLIEKGHAEVYE